MRTAETVVQNPSGIHARPAAMFVRSAAGYKAAVRLVNLDGDGASADAKSMIAVMKAAAKSGHRIRIETEGPDEDAAIEGMIAFVDGGCGEKVPG